MKIENKVAVISGGDSGIGLAISQKLKEEKVRIYDISKVITNNPIFEKSYECDISDDETVRNVVDDILKREGNIDLLFCNAGFGIGGRFENSSIETIDNIMNVNLIAHMKMVNLFAKHINEHGKIIFTGSLASIIPLPYQACYSASKAGIENFSRAIATELKDKKIGVCTVMPGDIKTSFTENRIKEISDDKIDKDEKRGIDKMENSERKGKSPEFVAKRVLKIVKKKRTPLRVSIGVTSKFISFLVKILPVRMVNFLVDKIYT